jgi:AraC-like DNA-binding protein
MMRDNSVSIKQIADTLNFTNQSHFGTFFRRHVGMSPQQFRQRNL